MSYRHQWGPPRIVRVGGGPNGFYTARQDCERCDTVRNPFTLLVVDRGGSRCWGAGPGDEMKSWYAELDRVRTELEAIADGGDAVRLNDSPGYPEHARTLRALG